MRSSGYHTETQQIVFDYLKQQKEKALSVQDIMDFLTYKKNTANITTVYRILGKLTEKGMAIKHNADDGKKALFQYAEPESGCLHHLHVQCTSCGRIFHLDCPEIAFMLEHIAKDHNIEISCSTSILYGICSICRNNTKI